jgi:hypothetical protein
MLTRRPAHDDDDGTPLACDLTALSPAERDAHTALARDLFTTALQATTELPDGYAFQFAADAYPRIAAFVASERRCCPFLTFTVSVPPHQSSIWLRLTGSARVKAFVQTTFDQR